MSCSTGDIDEMNAMREWIEFLSSDALVRAMEFGCLADADGDGSSHEFDLLEQMVKSQPPPPTPIHPRALSFKPASTTGATDGRNEEERVRRIRFRCPRLFQFIERESTGCGKGGGGVGSRRHRPVGRSRHKQRYVFARRFDVIARKFVTPWGDILSIGCTNEEQQADDIILKGTGIKHGSESKSFRGIFRREPGSTTEGAKPLLRMLQVASRGKFLTLPFSSLESTSGGRTTISRIPFCAPWLDPTTQFFSLPMYLASRYEVALWTSFRRYQSGIPVPVPENVALQQLSRENVSRAVLKAVALTLSADILPELSASQLRDSTLWYLLGSPWLHGMQNQSSPILDVQCIGITSLPELGSKTGELRRLVDMYLQEALAREVENDLIRSLSEEPRPLRKVEPGRKKRSKKKKRSKRRNILPVVHEEKKTTGNSSNEGSDDEESSDDNLGSIRGKTNQLPVSPPSRSRNRNTIAVLSLLDEVVESVFDRVGLNTPEDPGDDPSNSLDDTCGKDTSLTQSATKQNDGDDQGVIEGMAEGDSFLSQQPTEVDSLTRDIPEQNVQPLSYGTLYGHYHADSGFLVTNSTSDFHLNFNDNWESLRPYQSRDKSLFTEFFLRQDISAEDQEEFPLASSTAASIASSSGIDEYDSEAGAPEDELEICEESEDNEGIDVSSADGNFACDGVRARGLSVAEELPTIADDGDEGSADALVCDSDTNAHEAPQENATAEEPLTQVVTPHHADHGSTPEAVSPCESPMRSPSPQAPKTPPPQLSPILVSLADLKKLQRRKTSDGLLKTGVSGTSTGPQSSVLVAGSLPSSPVLPTSNNGLTPSWSREDLRISSFTDDQQFRRKGQLTTGQNGSLSSSRSAVAESGRVAAPPERKVRDSKDAVRAGLTVPDFQSNEERKIPNKGSYAKSEATPEGHEEGRHWNVYPKHHTTDETDNVTTTKDGSTTISSALSPHESDDTSSLREERNSFRDMCLTLGAEVAMLKNLLAAEKSSKFYPSAEYSQDFQQVIHRPPPYGPAMVPPYFQGIPNGMSSSRTVAAMSDAGVHRGDHDSINVSEDGTDIVGPHDNPGNLRAVHVRRMDSATFLGSDASMDHTLSATSDFRTLNREAFGSVPSHGLHSRLTKDIMNFLNATSAQLRKQSGRRRLATERLSRLINALWPRAQVKLYGSHVSGNCLPSSDLDFVICLPAVHKKTPAVAPGVLEGRNAINETSQKLLARKLKGESWIDPNTIKIVERTAVPVIKVSTKDTRARVLQLDISFDGPEHGGLAAIDLVKTVMQELPMIRPLLLVLKQFLLDRGLLTAFTGGLSSYCLFLMIARYLQEQPSSWGDCGSLLMGFLDFYGNSFDPRATGISVRRRQYFSRLNYSAGTPYGADQHMWNAAHPPHALTSPGPPLGGSPEFLRRHSFSEKAANTGNSPSPPSTVHGMRPPRFQPPLSSSPRRFVPYIPQHKEDAQYAPYDHVAKPYTFDPLFVEDPLSPGNNVGRNAFRINQVQRAFSDAHRALVASLEWDIYSSSDLHDGVDYPLLKCLLQSEDVFYELEDPR